MANRTLLPETFMAVGSLILGIPYLVKNEETFTNITTAQVTALTNSPEVQGILKIRIKNVVWVLEVQGYPEVFDNQMLFSNYSIIKEKLK